MMILYKRKTLMPALLVAVFAAHAAWADNAGQEDLDKAIETRLSATTLSDLGEVIRLAESALDKGLDQANKEFADKLLASTLVQRATEFSAAIFKAPSPPAQWPQIRRLALADLEKAVQLNPKQPQALVLIARLNLLPDGDQKRAKSAVDKAVDFSADDPQARAKALVLRSNLEENLEKRLPDLDEAVKLTPNDFEAVSTRGFVLADLGKYDEALADLTKAIELDSTNLRVYEAKAIVLVRMKKLDEAIQVLNKVAAIDPSNVRALLLRSSLYLEKGDKDKAAADAKAAVALRPKYSVALYNYAAVLADLGKLDEAREQLEKVHQLEPNDPVASLRLGAVYSMQKRSAKAVEVYSEFLKDHPDEPNILRARGDSYLNVGKHAEAIADYEQAVKNKEFAKDPAYPGLLNNFAWVLATSPDDKLRDGARAVKLAAQACELTQYKQAYILSTLAAAYAETGDFDNAVKWSEKSAEIGDKDHAEAFKKELASYKDHKPYRELLLEKEPEKSGEKTPGAAEEKSAASSEKPSVPEEKSSGPQGQPTGGEKKPEQPETQPAAEEEKSPKAKPAAAGSVELFNGKNLDGWLMKPPRDRSKWAVGPAKVDPQNPQGLIVALAGPEPGDLVNLEAHSVDLYTVQKFGDCTIDLEFMVPKGSNSGVYIMGEYEIQILDSFGKKEVSQGDLGAIYGVSAPKVNAARPPGEWQTMSIEFKAPRFEEGKKTANARVVKIILNGQTIQEDVELKGPTPGGLTGNESPEGPLMFQGDHGPVAFRNIKVKR
jgi:tetratricopeptide (TPR) repeat protein